MIRLISLTSITKRYIQAHVETCGNTRSTASDTGMAEDQLSGYILDCKGISREPRLYYLSTRFDMKIDRTCLAYYMYCHSLSNTRLPLNVRAGTC